MAPFYGYGSTARGTLKRESLLFITKFQEIPGTSGIPGMK